MPKDLTTKLAMLMANPAAPAVTFILGIILGGAIFGEAQARDWRQVTEVTNVTNVTNSTGIAMAIASAQHHFDFGTHSWQGSFSTGHFDNNTAVSFGVGKRFDRMLINGSVGNENGKTSLGAGVNWRF